MTDANASVCLLLGYTALHGLHAQLIQLLNLYTVSHLMQS